MTPPVKDALQGGYLVAVVVSGCIVGAASMFFRELTEGLGCALGGFCVSMWLLCLVPGGLLHAVASKAIFIACFTLGGFAFYFSHYTRDWALILMISFSGATVTVLGIDCFSRAGLKEFWAYVWNLNDKLFPLGANTYPVTKGIRVETAAIIILFLFGIISQIKLWKIVRDKREKRAEEEAEGQRNLQEEEENVGRNVEEMNARDRRQWERIYGDGDVASSTLSHSSDNGDIRNEKKFRTSNTDSSQCQPSIEVIEMTDMADSTLRNSVTPTLMTADNDRTSKITVRVAADETPRSPMVEEVDEKAGVASSDGQTLVPGVDYKRTSGFSSISQPRGPDIVPLPFTIPVGDDAQSEAERSSVATFADEEDDAEPSGTGPRRPLVTRLSRLSHGSTDMLKRLSRGSLREQMEAEHGESSEDLVIPRTRHHGSDDGSVAATIDDESVSSDNRRSLPAGKVSKSIEIAAELSDKEKPSTSGNDQPAAQAKAEDTGDQTKADHGEEEPLENAENAKSATSKDSNMVSLTKDKLPRSLSRVAMSYRTNEWAKHLSQADAPEPDALHIEESQVHLAPVMEKAAPVHVEDLQKRADQGTPPPAITRSDSQASLMSSMSNTHPVSRRGSRQHMPTTLTIPGALPMDLLRSPNGTPPSAGLPRSSSAGLRRISGQIEPIAEERDPASDPSPTPDEVAKLRRQSTSPVPAVEGGRHTPTPGIVSYASPQTLLGQREMFLRNKSQGSLVPNTPDLTINKPASDAGSLYNYPMYAAAFGADADDIPLSQRKQIMRHSSQGASASRLSLVPSIHSNNGNNREGGIGVDSPEAPFDSHQPKRSSTQPNAYAREAALANFRQSVQHDLRAGTPVLSHSGRETPFAPSSLLGGGGREAEVQRNIEMGRNVLMGQKEADAQRREMQRREKEWAERAFDERMRSGDLLDAHRDAMRRMQMKSKDQ